MEVPSIDLQLKNLWQHPILAPIFTDPGAPRSQRLEEVLLELGTYGEVVLGSHDQHKGTRGQAQEWVCSLHWRVADEELVVAEGVTPTLAALRCLMEVLYYIKKLSKLEGFY